MTNTTNQTNQETPKELVASGTDGLVLKIFEGGGYKFSFPTKGGRVTEYRAPTDNLIAEYTDAAAWGKWWRVLFDRKSDDSKAIILAAYPDILERDASNMRHPDKILNNIAIILKKADKLKTCTRCGGTGNYSYNHRDGTVCFKCGGFKVIYPKISKKFLGIIAEHFAERKKAKDGGGL